MTFRILSDIHLEFAPFSPLAIDADAIVLTGSTGEGLSELDWGEAANSKQPDPLCPRQSRVLRCSAAICAERSGHESRDRILPGQRVTCPSSYGRRSIYGPMGSHALLRLRACRRDACAVQSTGLRPVGPERGVQSVPSGGSMTVSDDRKTVMDAATALAGDPLRADRWFRTQPIPELSGKTAEQLVLEGRAADVLKYIAMLETGSTG